MENNFEIWLNRRDNSINEGLLSWFSNLFKQKDKVIDPDEMTKVIYRDPLVQRYTQEVLRHLGVSNGAKVDLIGNSGEKTGEWIVDWSQNHQFIEAMQRFVASHIIGNGENTSFLRISHHDAIVIINTLSQMRQPKSHTDIADELHIENPMALATWIQTKVPVADSARMQQGYSAGSDDYRGSRFRTGKGDPTSIPQVRKLVDASEEVVKLSKKRKEGSTITTGLYGALRTLDAALFSLTGRDIDGKDPRSPKRKERNNANIGTGENI